MTKEFTGIVTKALDECAPIKKFKINKNYNAGVSEETKTLINERNNLRKQLKKISE